MKSLRKRYSTLTAVKVLMIAFAFSLVACCAKKPFVTTVQITNIKTTSATSGGNVIANSGLMVTGRGVCWGTTPNPNVYSSVTHDGQGYGSFVSNLEGLSPNTTYYVRAVATTLKGPVYGEQVSFETDPTYITDIDGTNYKVIRIGNQLWMGENLKTTKFNDGTTIKLITDNEEWANSTRPAYCWYNNDMTTYEQISGALYNYYAVYTGKLCPVGWQVPSDAEWHQLILYLDNNAVLSETESSIAGGKLKATTIWGSPNTGADNSSGFTAFPGGYRTSDTGQYSGGPILGYWWSYYEWQSTRVVYRGLSWNNAAFYRGAHENIHGQGLSVRCLKDN